MKVKSKRFIRTIALVALLPACANGTDEPASATTSADVVSTQVPSTFDVTQAPPTTVVATTVDDGITRISVTVGVDSGPDRIEEVALGTRVELTVVNPDDDDEFHLHGYDLGGDETPAGDEKVFAFTATEAGDFEVESHATNDVLVVIRVSSTTTMGE